MRISLHSLPGPPSPNHPIRLANVLHNMTGTLSDCIYQSLTGMTQEKDALGGSRTSQRKATLGPATGTCNILTFDRPRTRQTRTFFYFGHRTLINRILMAKYYSFVFPFFILFHNNPV